MSRTLSLPAKAYLLACDARRGRLANRRRTALLVRGAALTELLLRGLIADSDGRVVVRSGSTGDLVLDDVLAELTASGPRRWRTWLRRGTRGTLQAVEAQLDAAGVIFLRTSGVFGVRSPVVREPGVAAELRTRVRAAVLGPVPVSEVDSVDAALAALAAAVRLRAVLSDGECRRHRGRLRQLEVRAGVVAPALRRLVRALDRARAGAAASSS